MDGPHGAAAAFAVFGPGEVEAGGDANGAILQYWQARVDFPTSLIDSA